MTRDQASNGTRVGTEGDMGHIRLARLPATKRWEQVVGLLRAGGSFGQLAADTAAAEIKSQSGDSAPAYSVWLLTQLPLAARSQQFRERLVELGLDADAGQWDRVGSSGEEHVPVSCARVNSAKG
jgi:hypothetical protein